MLFMQASSLVTAGFSTTPQRAGCCEIIGPVPPSLLIRCSVVGKYYINNPGNVNIIVPQKCFFIAENDIVLNMQHELCSVDVDQQAHGIRHRRDQRVCHNRRVNADPFGKDRQHAADYLRKHDNKQD